MTIFSRFSYFECLDGSTSPKVSVSDHTPHKTSPGSSTERYGYLKIFGPAPKDNCVTVGRCPRSPLRPVTLSNPRVSTTPIVGLRTPSFFRSYLFSRFGFVFQLKRPFGRGTYYLFSPCPGPQGLSGL